MKGFVPPPRYGGVQYGGEPLPITREITVTEGISVKDLAEKLEVRAKDLIATLLMTGVFVTVNQSLDAEMIKDVSAKFGAALPSSATKKRSPTRPSRKFSKRKTRASWKFRVRLWSPSWAMWITARLRCSTPSGKPTWRPARPAALRSTSAHTR
jgi:hypothetical protein